MERTKYITRILLVISVLLFSLQLSFSQSSYRDLMYKAYSRGKMDKWYQLMHVCEKNANQHNLEEQLELISYYYGYTAWLINAKKYDTAEKYIEKTEIIIDKLLIKSPKNATLHAYKGAFIAFEIGVSSYKAVYLGRKSVAFIDKSLALDPENIQGNIEKGNSLYYCPPVFGGNKKDAIKYYIRAVNSFEKQGLVVNNWMYINTMTALGQAYEATNQIQKAKTCYEKIIRIFPNFMWVEEELYPDLLKRHNL